MDIKKFEKISNAKIVAGKKTRDVRNMLKKYKEEKHKWFGKCFHIESIT